MRGQRRVVFNHLVEHGELTSMDAFKLYGCTRLAAIVCDFRKMGYDILTVDEDWINRYGSHVKYARYVMTTKERAKWQNRLQ